jgi:hypothetical protein
MIISDTDKWMILSATRTGSTLIVDFIRSVYESNLKTIHFISHDMHECKDYYVKHSHTLQDYFLFKDDPLIKIVISTRDIIESSLSWCITKRHKVFYSYDEKSKPTMEPFVLDSEELLYTYSKLKEFYLGITDINDRTIIIDYDQFKDDPRNLFKLLDLESYADSTQLKLPIKNEPYKVFIKNWNEIEKLADTLKNNKPFLVKDRLTTLY